MTSPQELFVEVILPLPLEKTFHYRVPENLAPLAKKGVRVTVPFGKKQLTGYVLDRCADSPVENLKDVLSVVDEEPVITHEFLSLAWFLSESYVCSIGEALGTLLPPSLRPPRRNTKKSEKAESVILSSVAPQLTGDQAKAVASITDAVKAKKPRTFLLHGVTSSGKTEVYLAAIRETLSQGRSAIFLLPEISLTPQFVGIVQKRFPGLVGLWHSKVSAGEKYRTWYRARKKMIRIMLGARSGLFAPFDDLGLIVVDEEHEPSYKQEQKPGYQTRDAAIERGRLNNAVVVLGSATPSFESYYRAQRGEYTLLELNERIDRRELPPVEIVDASRIKGASRILSAPLITSLTRALARREQAIIFLNRRGFSPGVMCHECGRVWECPHCSISLVYHRNPDRLQCHYCNFEQPFPVMCPACKSRHIAVFGVGTQKVEEDLKRHFPQGRIFRLDRDTASKKGVYQKAYEGFKREDFDILLGTQMVVKGFDFPRVTLVGVVDADTALYIPDFRAAERTFQLITQVAGRSGRSDLGGQVIVQSRHPDHYALRAAQSHDFKGFYRQEIEYRRQMNYPPFCRLANILFRGRNEERVEEAARAATGLLERLNAEKGFAVDILGPTPAAHAKLYNLFRWQALLKGGINHLLECVRELRKHPLPSGVLMSVDVDPQDTL